MHPTISILGLKFRKTPQNEPGRHLVSAGFPIIIYLVGCLQPVSSNLIRKMGDFKIGECHLEAVSIWTGCKHTDLYRPVLLHPGIPHHFVIFIIKGIKNLYGIKSSDSLYPQFIDWLVKCYNAPVRRMMSDYCTDIIFAIDKFYSGLEIIFMAILIRNYIVNITS